LLASINAIFSLATKDLPSSALTFLATSAFVKAKSAATPPIAVVKFVLAVSKSEVLT
jgi:hypothetical protein